MGALQDVFANQCSTDIFCATGNAWLSHEEWSRQADAVYLSKSGTVTTIVLGKADVDQVLSELGVVQRVGRNVENITRIDHSLSVSNARRVSSVGEKIKKQKSIYQPRDLQIEDLQDLVSGEVKYQEIMEMYHFESVRYFKAKIKPLGYRLLRGELWVVKDRLWLH